METRTIHSYASKWMEIQDKKWLEVQILNISEKLILKEEDYTCAFMLEMAETNDQCQMHLNQ